MISSVRWLDADELSHSLDYIRPLDVLGEELTGRAAGGGPRTPHRDVSLTPWRHYATGSPATELVLLEDERTGAGCVLSAAGLRACRAAALTGLAARLLLVPGAVTAAVVGSGLAAQTQLMVIVQHVRGVSHIAIYPGEDGGKGMIEPKVLDQIDFAGIGLSVLAAADEAVFSADLIVTTGAAPAELYIRAMAKGAVVVNATNLDLPDTLVDSVDQLYIDRAELVGDNLDRYFAKTHSAGMEGNSEWSYQPDAWRHQRRIDADLGQVLTGTHPGRSHRDQILLVELLSAKALDVRLASMLYQAANERGLGSQLLK